MSNGTPREATPNGRPTDDGNVRDLPRRQSGLPRRAEDLNEQAATTVQRVAFETTREIDRLMDDLHKLRSKLENDGNRIQRDIADYVTLSQSVVQLTKIVSDSMSNTKEFEAKTRGP
jgi:hypothetical protein